MDDLTQMPARFSAGASVTYTRTVDDYPASDGWTLKVYLAGVAGTAVEATVTTDADGRRYVVTIPGTATAALATGGYRYVERVSKTSPASGPWEVGRGSVMLDPNVATGGAGDPLQTVERAIALVTARIEGRLTTDMDSFIIAGRSVTKIPMDKLEATLARLENKRARILRGGTRPQPVLMRFTASGRDA